MRHATLAAILAASIAAACTPGRAPAAAAPSATAPSATAPSAAAAAPSPAAAPTAAAGATRTYGAPIEAKEAPTPLASVLAKPEDFAGKPVLVDGKVRANCTAKGCWMELAEGLDPAAPGCRVTFKDYGFFIPVNSRGAAARVEGQLALKTIPAAEVAHLEGEGGHFPRKQPDGSVREVRIVASGVELTRAN